MLLTLLIEHNSVNVLSFAVKKSLVNTFFLVFLISLQVMVIDQAVVFSGTSRLFLASHSPILQ